jgi:hypothetical protein
MLTAPTIGLAQRATTAHAKLDLLEMLTRAASVPMALSLSTLPAKRANQEASHLVVLSVRPVQLVSTHRLQTKLRVLFALLALPQMPQLVLLPAPRVLRDLTTHKPLRLRVSFARLEHT